MSTATEPAVTTGTDLMMRLFGGLLGTIELTTVYLGVRLGLYGLLSTPRTAAELAEAAGIDARYAREWLEQQAIAGFVSVAADGTEETRRYVLDADQHAALVDPDSAVSSAPMALMLGGLAEALPRLPDIFTSGAGLSFGEFGDDVRLGQGLFNRGGYLGQLAEEWLPQLPAVETLLRREGAIAVDIGCGVGWSSIALARAFPGLSVLGIDNDDASVMDARHNAAEAGLEDRVRFEVASASDPLPEATYDVGFFFECLHDLPHPVPSLQSVRRALRPGGRVVVMDERAEENFAPGGSELERLLAGFSVVHCLPVGRVEPGSAETGALFRPTTMRRYAEEAGYAETVIAPIEHDMFRFYELVP